MRLGPNRVRIFGLLPGMGQPFADVIKLLIKEIVIPARANKLLFALAPAITLIPAFAAWAVVPIAPHYAIANVDAGLLYVLSLTSMGVYGIILAGWASNSKYAFLGAMRSAAQMVAYEIAMGFALVGVLMASQQPESRHHRRAPTGRSAGAGTGSGCCRCWWCTSSPGSPRPIARRSTWPRASPRSSRDSTWNTRAWRSRCSSSPNTPT